MSDKTTAKPATEPDAVLIGRRITLWLREREMSAAALGRAVGSNSTVVWKWQTGVHVPGTDKLARIAAALGHTMDELVAPARPIETEPMPAEAELVPTEAELEALRIVLDGNHTAEQRAIALKAIRAQAAIDARKRAEAAELLQKRTKPDSGRPPPPRPRRKRRSA